MSEYLDALERQCAKNPLRIAYRNSAGEVLTYGQLDQAARRIQARIASEMRGGALQSL